ncbi:hypothetical protein FOZ63_015935, partial [Perkinsus olseni]
SPCLICQCPLLLRLTLMECLHLAASLPLCQRLTPSPPTPMVILIRLTPSPPTPVVILIRLTPSPPTPMVILIRLTPSPPTPITSSLPKPLVTSLRVVPMVASPRDLSPMGSRVPPWSASQPPTPMVVSSPDRPFTTRLTSFPVTWPFPTSMAVPVPGRPTTTSLASLRSALSTPIPTVAAAHSPTARVATLPSAPSPPTTSVVSSRDSLPMGSLTSLRLTPS